MNAQDHFEAGEMALEGHASAIGGEPTIATPDQWLAVAQAHFLAAVAAVLITGHSDREVAP